MTRHTSSFTFTVSTVPTKTFLALDVTDLGEPVVTSLMAQHAAWRHVTPSSPAAIPVPETSVSEGRESPGSDLEVEMNGKVDKSVPRHEHILLAIRERNKQLLQTGQVPPSGWDETTIKQVLAILPEAQRNVILAAAAANGPLGRVAVYAAAGRSAEKSLKGFTRPVTGAIAKLQAKGNLQGERKALLQQIYDPDVKTYLPVQGLQIPLEVAVLIQQMGLVAPISDSTI